MAKIFPITGRKVEAPEIPLSASPPAKRKERSLSSLVVNTPRVSMQAGVTGRRTRAGVRKGSASRGASSANEETPKKDEDSIEDHLDGSSSPETLNKIIQNKKQVNIIETCPFIPRKESCSLCPPQSCASQFLKLKLVNNVGRREY